MRIFLGLGLLILNFTPVFSQDIIVLRKNEEEIKCKIISVDDSFVKYKKWKSIDQSTQSVRKFEVLSFMIEAPSKESDNSEDASLEKNDTDILGEYHTGKLVSGYVIKENNDTLAGQIRIYNVALNQVEVRFISDKGDSAIFTTHDIKGYGYMGIEYEKINTGYTGKITNGYDQTDGKLFLHYAINGPSKLYRFYKLIFQDGVIKSYGKHPPAYFGKLTREFFITNPAGENVFTKGRTIKGSVNRIYFDYQDYFKHYPLNNPQASNLPSIVTNFNHWFSNKN